LRLRPGSGKLGKLSKPVLEARAASHMMRSALAAIVRTSHLAKTVFTIAPGAPFLKTFADALFGGRIVEAYSARLDPLELSDATMYVPTRRAARALAGELSRALGRPAMLPRILPLGALEEAETGLLATDGGLEDAYQPGILEAATEIERRMLLAELILQWARRLPHAIVSADAEGNYEFDPLESFLIAPTPVAAWHLSGELAKLIDELIIEDVAWTRLDPLALPELDKYWQITLNFLSIAIKEWPQILAGRRCVDKAHRQAALIDAQCRRLEEGAFESPVIAIGSTGTNRATARLLAAIAGAPNGAIVLPGLDLDLDAHAFAMIAGDSDCKIEASFTHPQSALSRLLGILRISRDDVVSLGEVSPSLAQRGKFVSGALCPAEATDGWTLYRERVQPCELSAALEGVTLIEAADEREEALALAIAMRHILEAPGETAALVTPDRKLARRVRAELQRWNVAAEDSAGEALTARPLGALARLLLDCAISNLAPADLAALFAHPFCLLGFSRSEIAKRGALAELALLRSPCAANGLAAHMAGGCSALIAAAKAQSLAPHAHPAKKWISAGEWTKIEELMARLSALFKPLLALEGSHRLDQWVSAHRAAIEKATEGLDGESREDKEALDTLFDELAANAPERLTFDRKSYAHFFAQVAGEVVVHQETDIDSRLRILGLLEARLIEADVMLLGGLDETIWPPEPRTDAFLNRPMREALGLTPPERRLGQTAHDFTQAMGSRKVILSRALKREGSPTVASRFVLRMAALGGDAFKACRERGDFYLHLAQEIDRPKNFVTCARPLPTPPLELRPERLSVTQIETLRRDPYAIYAEKILRLKELDPLGGSFGPAEFGSAIHEVLGRFAAEHPAKVLPENAQEKLTELMHEALAAQLLDPAFAALKWPQVQKMIRFYLGFEAARRDKIRRIETEREGELNIPLSDESMFHLTARADRIEVNKDGSVTLVDYKTGTVPSQDEISAGFAPQLTLEAAMATRGAFDLGQECNTATALYVKLGGSGGGEEKTVNTDFIENHFRDLIELLNQFRDEATAYPPRPFPEHVKKYNAYDHLARVKEWSRGGGADDGGVE
jgi:ATP-dependent helicase/nuclease subunit B